MKVTCMPHPVIFIAIGQKESKVFAARRTAYYIDQYRLIKINPDTNVQRKAYYRRSIVNHGLERVYFEWGAC